MKKLSLLITLFSSFLLCGGIMGFIKAQSLISLVMSLGFSIALYFCSYFSAKEKMPALYGAALLVLTLNIFFLIRYLKSFALFPAGVMTIASTLVGIPLLAYLTNRVKQRRYE